MKKWTFWLLAALLFTHISAPAIAEACSCIADPYTKKYLHFKKTWYGTKRKWTCVYTCQDDQQKRTQITGTHEDWYVTDKGLEGICDGLRYENTYSVLVQDFVWLFEEAQWFPPGKSTAPELKKWKSESCR